MYNAKLAAESDIKAGLSTGLDSLYTESMTASPQDFSRVFEGVLTLSGWEKYHTKAEVTCGDVSIPGLRQEVYLRTIDDAVLSVGVFSYEGSPAFLAWGLKSAKHCGWHARLSPDGLVLTVLPGCPELIPLLSDGTVVGFEVDGETMLKPLSH